MKFYQATISHKISIVGVGLHTGKFVKLRIEPAPKNTGILFSRVDLEGKDNIIPGNLHHVVKTELCTTIGVGNATLSTVEHLMAAFSLLGIDNAYVYVDAPEIPILDGSAAPFVDRILEVGIQKQAAFREQLRCPHAFRVGSEDSYIAYTPSLNSDPQLHIDAFIDFSSQAIGQQKLQLSLQDGSLETLAQARTFCHLNDIQGMRKRGLARGGSLDNAVVVNDTEVINSEGLRTENEFVMHKVLDFIGDMALLGGTLLGHVQIVRGGHKLHYQFAKRLLEGVSSTQRKSPATACANL